ncbi:hypothetical protein JEQ12_017537 [Ovis aries]|uniref:Cyclin-G1 n=1 Tax=Ovis aries TaxID=9940 RepID=A0A836A4R4_SHEEP|nr:hypothetical protein JEQ12_017537 [Ovis aries]
MGCIGCFLPDSFDEVRDDHFAFFLKSQHWQSPMYDGSPPFDTLDKSNYSKRSSNQTIHRKHTEGQKNHFLGANRLLFRVEQENVLFTDLPVEQMAREEAREGYTELCVVSLLQMKDLGAEYLAGREGVQLFGLLNLYLEQEQRFQPREKGLSLIEATPETDNTLCPRLRNAKVEDLRSLTNFFGSCTETFVLAVNILDRFLALMKVKPKHLSCIGVCCFLLAARIVEEECNIPSTHDVIRISQCKCTASDIKRMEKIISEKLHYEFEATTALNFLHLYHTIVLCHTSERKEILSLDKLEAQLKACCCRLTFSKAKPSVLALCLLNLEVETLKSIELLEILLLVKKHSKVNDSEFVYWRELVSKCLAEYSSPECCKPDLKKLVWIVSRRTAQNLHNSYYSVPELPTIPEGGCFDESESEDSCEDMSCGEESLSSSPHRDQECTFFFSFKVAQTLCFPS